MEWLYLDPHTPSVKFEKEFQTESQCRAYIIRLRYKAGKFTCPLCRSKRSYPVKDNFYECAQCGHQESILSGTLFRIRINHCIYGFGRFGILLHKRMEQALWGYRGYWGLEIIKRPGFGCINCGGQW
ncbi:MAG: transposase [Treponema sp.]|nr:transposase [Treponema sp.]